MDYRAFIGFNCSRLRYSVKLWLLALGFQVPSVIFGLFLFSDTTSGSPETRGRPDSADGRVDRI